MVAGEPPPHCHTRDSRSWGCPGPPVKDTVLIGEQDSMVNKIVSVNKIVWFGPSLRHCRESLDKIVW